MSKEKKFTRNKQQKIDLIINIAYDLIIEKGYDQLITNHIADRAKIGIGTIYRNFPNGKADIMREIVNRNRKKIVNLDLFSGINESKLPFSINQTMLNFIKFHRENLQFHLAFEQSYLSNKEIFHDFKSSVEEMLLKLVKKLKKNNMFENFSEIVLNEKLFLIFNVVESIILRHILIIPLFETDEEFGAYLTDLILFHFSNR
ncbi:MAG TPA: helix-turn-helix domain-containing protein [Candidatus Lokiarchaeia archaeon]